MTGDLAPASTLGPANPISGDPASPGGVLPREGVRGPFGATGHACGVPRGAYAPNRYLGGQDGGSCAQPTGVLLAGGAYGAFSTTGRII